MRYSVIVAALMACGPAMAGDTDCGTNPNVAVGVECMARKFGGGLIEAVPNNTFSPLQKQPPAHFQKFPNPEKLSLFAEFAEQIIVGIGVGSIQSYRLGTGVIAMGRCAGASLVKGSNVILLGDYAAAPGPETNSYINWRNETCLHYGVVVKCPPPEPECVK